MVYYPNFPLSLFLFYHGEGSFMSLPSLCLLNLEGRDYMTVGKVKYQRGDR